MKKKEIRTTKIILPDPFAGQYLVFRTNPRLRVWRGLSSGNIEKMLSSLAALGIDSNITDDDDMLIDVTTADGWDCLDEEDLEVVATAMVEALKAPKVSANGSST